MREAVLLSLNDGPVARKQYATGECTYSVVAVILLISGVDTRYVQLEWFCIKI